MKTLTRSVVFGVVLAGSLAANAQAQAANPFVGTWKLASWKGTPGPGPKAVTVKIEAAGPAFKYTVSGTGADGKPIAMSYTVAYDGKDVPVTGAPDYDMINVKAIDANTRHTVRSRGGKPVQTVHSVLSADGKHYTSTTTGTNAKGEKISSTATYDRQ